MNFPFVHRTPQGKQGLSSSHWGLVAFGTWFATRDNPPGSFLHPPTARLPVRLSPQVGVAFGHQCPATSSSAKVPWLANAASRNGRNEPTSRSAAFEDPAICLFVNVQGSIRLAAVPRSRRAARRRSCSPTSHAALVAETAELRLSNAVEVDGAYFGVHLRPAKLKADRADCQSASNFDPLLECTPGWTPSKGSKLHAGSHLKGGGADSPYTASTKSRGAEPAPLRRP